MDQAHAGIVAAVIAAVSSSAVAIVLAISGLVERRLDRRRETMLKALEYLSGDSQKRSVGIALIEGMWFDGHPYDKAIMPALVNQAVYLLLETERGGQRHEFHNWLRIMDLILRIPAKKEFHNLYCELADALYVRCEEKPPRSEGLEMSRPTAQIWLKKLSSHAGLGLSVEIDSTQSSTQS